MDMPKSWTGQNPLSEADPELQKMISLEKNRQKTGLELIASEVISMASLLAEMKKKLLAGIVSSLIKVQNK